jgi:hypothetical protein
LPDPPAATDHRQGAPHESYYSVTTLVLEVMGLDD